MDFLYKVKNILILLGFIITIIYQNYCKTYVILGVSRETPGKRGYKLELKWWSIVS